jgi:ABC-type phosphate/phosphonate transport system substrate-binding protein
MIGIAKTEEDLRNEYGMPVSAHVPDNRGNFHQAVDNSQNKALPWIAFSWFLSGAALIGVMLMAVLMPQMMDAKVKAGVAASEERARTSDVNARIALDKVEDFRAKLAEKGINVNPDGH